MFVPCLSLISISSYVVQGTKETGNIHCYYPRTVASLMPHESFNSGYSPDIMVVKTNQPFQLTKSVKTIKLAEFGVNPKGNYGFTCIA